MLHALCSDTPYGKERIEFGRSFEGHKWVRGGDKLANGKEMSPAAAAKKNMASKLVRERKVMSGRHPSHRGFGSGPKQRGIRFRFPFHLP